MNSKIIEQFKILYKQVKEELINSKMEPNAAEIKMHYNKLKDIKLSLKFLKSTKIIINGINDIATLLDSAPTGLTSFARRVSEVVRNGGLEEIDTEKIALEQANINSMYDLARVPEMDESLARKLVFGEGVRSVTELKLAIDSNSAVVPPNIKSSIRFVDKINQNVTRNVLMQYQNLIANIAAEIDPKFIVSVCTMKEGSKIIYTDINCSVYHQDIQYIKFNPTTIKRIDGFTRLVDELRRKKYVIEIFSKKKFNYVGVSRIEQENFYLFNINFFPLMNQSSPQRISKHCQYYHALYLKKMIFPLIFQSKVPMLQIDVASMSYITFADVAEEITEIILENITDIPCPSGFTPGEKEHWSDASMAVKVGNLVISDMTAGVGGNILNFAKYFKYVNAFEIEPDRFAHLVNNVGLYEFQNVNCANVNSVKILANKSIIYQDIIFFDPPWGGSNYKEHDKLRLVLGEYGIEELSTILFEKSHNKVIVMKLPNNYDIDYIREQLAQFNPTIIILERMTIVIIKNYESKIAH